MVYTDVWASMGQKEEAEERKRVFQGFQACPPPSHAPCSQSKPTDLKASRPLDRHAFALPVV